MKETPRGIFRVGHLPTGRIEALSDGVFAVAITLLVLEIHVPVLDMPPGADLSHALGQELLALTPKFLSYVLSFALICIWWVGHHNFFHTLQKADRGLVWLNSLFLLWLAFIPFPTALMGSYPHQRIAIMAYGIVNMLAGISFTTMRYYAFYVAGLGNEALDAGLVRRAMIKSIMNPVLLGIAVLLALVDIRITLAFYVIIPLLFVIPSRLDRTAKRD